MKLTDLKVKAKTIKNLRKITRIGRVVVAVVFQQDKERNIHKILLINLTSLKLKTSLKKKYR